MKIKRPAPSILLIPLLMAVLAMTGRSAEQVSTGLQNVHVYPNPWKSDLHRFQMINFAECPVSSTVKIFTLSGHKIRTLAVDSNGLAGWDRTTDAGQRVASGIYIFLVRDPQGRQTSGKLAIIQ